MNIKELAFQTVTAMLDKGLTPHGTWGLYGQAYVPIIKMHEEKGVENFDSGLIDAFVLSIENRMEKGEISWRYCRNLKTYIERLTEFHDTGKLEWSCHGRISKFKLNEYYERVLAEFINSENFHSNTRGDLIWIGKKYFAWLIQDGCSDLKSVGATEIQHFMIYCSRHMKSSGVHNVKLYMKKLYRYLAQAGYSAETYEGLFSFPVCRESRLLPAVPPEEVLVILEAIDRQSPKGKRDYAIILLGIVTGLRAIDIARLKLSDISWKSGEIKIVQAKTGASLSLPLTKDVGEAIQDYILNGRQKTTSDAVFLRNRAPFQGFVNGVAIGYMYNDYLKKAGLPRDAFDGKGFHALRRAVGKNMITSDVPVATVAQILGHENIDSTKKYISLDSRHLKECALDFTGIEPEVMK